MKDRIAERLARSNSTSGQLTEALGYIDEQTGEISRLRALLAQPCRYHHLPLINGWAHSINQAGGSKKTIRCPLSKEVREELAK